MTQFDVVILPSFAQAEAWSKQRANNQAAGLFAQTVTTFDAWIADLWELYGDGRLLVSDVQRELLMAAVCAQQFGEKNTPGLAPLAASCMRSAAGVLVFEQALDAARGGATAETLGVAEEELTFLQVLAAYRDALESKGLVEQGSACALLANQNAEVFPRQLEVLMAEAAPFTWIQQQFFAQCSQLNLTVQNAEGAQGIPQAPEGIQLQFAFPSGRLAQPGLIADEVLNLTQVSAGNVVVVCKDPLSVATCAEERLVAQGLHVCVQARTPFAQTDFGRAYLAMWACVNANPWQPAMLTDVLLSPFSGISQAEAFAIDKEVRGNRLAEREQVLGVLRAKSELFSQLEELAISPEADILLGVFEQMVQASAQHSPAWRNQQLAAMGVLRQVTTAARQLHAGIDDCAAVLQRISVPVSWQNAENGQALSSASSVVFTTQAVASRMPVGSCQALIVADLTSEDYPVADRSDAARTLLEKLGLSAQESALSQARRTFSALCRIPSNALVVMRPLGDSNADPTYPSVVLEEFIDAYRADVSATDDIDNAYRLPQQLQGGLTERGEELLFANQDARGATAVQAAADTISYPDLGTLDSAAATRVVRARLDSQGKPLAKPCLSPSQIEAYMECPYQWFASRRLQIGGLDEGFGPLERGSFAHAAFETFYQRFQESGNDKVTNETLPEARVLMQQVLQELIEQQFSAEPSSGRLVYTTKLEQREVEQFCDQLLAFLDFEAKLLPTFHPAYFEYKIDADHAVEYGGNLIVGMVDRIDVDDQGHAVIIDYKGSLNAEHDIAGKNLQHAGKVQTRIYAQAIRRALGLQVVGALYVSYGRKPALSGAYDARVLEVPHLPGINPKKSGCGTTDTIPEEWPDDFSFANLSFNSMLDATESLAGEAIQRMCAGQVSPNPAYADACKYCPVLTCPKRGA